MSQLNGTDWLHCNNCYKVQPQMGQIIFSNCGHIFCQKCILNSDQNSLSTNCPVCKKPVKFVAVDKNLNNEIKMYFKSPHEVAAQYMQQLKKVLDFQSSNRSRLNKYQQERTLKMQKYLEGNSSQLKKMQDVAKKLHVEKEQLLAKQEQFTREIHDLNLRFKQTESKLRDKEREIAALQDMRRSGSDSGVSSLNSLNNESFSTSGFLTSTPIRGTSPISPSQTSSSGKSIPGLFRVNTSPIAFDSDMFDMKNKRTGSHNVPRPGSDFFNNQMSF